MTEYFAPCVACSVLQEVAVVVKEHGTGLYLSEWKDAVLHAHLHSKLSSYCYTHHHCVSDQTLTSQCAFLYTVQPPQVVFPGLGTKGAVLAHRRGRGGFICDMTTKGCGVTRFRTLRYRLQANDHFRPGLRVGKYRPLLASVCACI